MIFKFELGEKVRDTVTGYEGIVTCRVEYLNGCIRYDVTARNEKPTDEPKGFTFDEDQLETLEPAKPDNAKKRTGGARPSPRRTGF